jgi:hypothetical protein
VRERRGSVRLHLLVIQDPGGNDDGQEDGERG